MAMHKTLADQYSSAVASVAVKALSAAQSSATSGNGTISVLNSDGTRTVIGVGAGTDETGGSVGVATFVGDTTPPGYPTGVSFQTGNGGITGIWAGTLYGGVPSDFDRVAFRVDGEEFGEVNCAGSAQSDALTVGQSYTCDAVAYDVQGNVSDACDAVTVTVRDVTLEAEAAAEAANEAQEAASEALAAAQESASELASQIDDIETAVTDLSTTVSGAVETADEALELATTVETSLTGFEATVSETYATYEYVDEGDDITIGGTNLLPGTRDWSSGLSSATATDEEYGGCVVASYTKSSTTSSFVDLFSYPSVLTEVDGSAAYTLSFWGRADADGVNITSFFYNSASGDIVASCTNSTGNSKNSADGNIVTTLSTEWERYWVTWVTQESPTPPVSLIPARMLASTTGTVYMAGAKLERGDVPTDWSPAPEDAEDAIADAQADATSALTQVSTLEVTVGEISATVEANYEYAEETYATKAALTETAESITAEVQAVSDTADDALEKATTVATDLAGFEATVEETYATKDEVYDVETAANEANELAATAYAAALASSSGVSYCTCETTAATADKVVDCDGFTLEAGATIIVAFTYANTAGALTMDVNGTGALPVEASGYETSTSNFLLWGAGTEVQFYTDGGSWVYAGGATSYVDVCATAADTAAKTVDRDNAVVTAGTRDVVTWTYGASYDEGASTFDLGGTVAQTVWYGDSATSADNPLSLNPGDTIALVYGGFYWFVSESTVLERCASLEVTCDEISATVESNYEYAEGTYATKTEVTETADSILSTVSETYVNAADAETTYVTASTLNQTANSITAMFSNYATTSYVDDADGELQDDIDDEVSTRSTLIRASTNGVEVARVSNSSYVGSRSIINTTGFYVLNSSGSVHAALNTGGIYFLPNGTSAANIQAYRSAVGYTATAAGCYATAMGRAANAYSNYAVAIGASSICNGATSVAFGYNARATGANSAAFGYGALASSNGSLAAGYRATANGANTIAAGMCAIASGTNGTAIGRGCKASADYAVALGADANASANRSCAIGPGVYAIGSWSTAMGLGSHSNSNYSVALGYSCTTTGANATAVGSLCGASGTASVAIGYNATASNSTGIAIGYNVAVSGSYSAALGRQSGASANYATALGYYATCANASGMQLGSSSTLSSLTCRVSLTTTSDSRDKADVEDVADGATEFLRALRAVTFVYNHRESYQYPDEDLTEDELELRRTYGLYGYDVEAWAAGERKGSRQRVGFLAQEVQEALEAAYGSTDYANLINDNLHDFDEVPDGVESRLAMNYEGLIPFIVKAIQEIDARVTALEGGT